MGRVQLRWTGGAAQISIWLRNGLDFGVKCTLERVFFMVGHLGAHGRLTAQVKMRVGDIAAAGGR